MKREREEEGVNRPYVEYSRISMGSPRQCRFDSPESVDLTKRESVN